ncbi:MAG: hypothetical protein JRF02_07585 [Deltaproteobacteria bacterium]|nr:hypothetical protein [Deltaproteobacteria bacterium]
MDRIERLRLLAELSTEHCELNHGPGTKGEDYPAVDYIVVNIGYKEDEVKEVSVRKLVIPVCAECAEALVGDEWTLLYCFLCGNNRWVSRQLAKLEYRHHVLWLRGCPECTKEFGGLYFADLPKEEGTVEFLVEEKELDPA